MTRGWKWVRTVNIEVNEGKEEEHTEQTKEKEDGAEIRNKEKR
jgi:hypothetical protein